MPANALEIDIDRLWRDLEVSGSIGRGKSTGLRRLALSDDDKTMRDAFVRWCRAAGCAIRVDAFGNIFARRAGVDATLPAVLIGSHLDTQIAGGRYDGILGVLAGLEVIRTLNDREMVSRRPIEIVSWTNEEGVRFQPPMLGSGAFAGIHPRGWVLTQTGDDGAVFQDELRRIGYQGADSVTPSEYDSYFELHIEQGPELEAEGIEVGIVTGGFTSFGAHLQIRGENAHAGPTPMKQRRNALVGAAIVIARLNEIGWRFAPEGRAAVCRIDVTPNKYGILPDLAEITIDVRHPQASKAAEMYKAALDLVPAASKEGNVDIEVTKEWSFGDISFDDDLINLVRAVAADLNVTHKHLRSAAGHDAYHLSRVVPTAMIFTPCKEGITHNEAEHIEPGYTAAGINVLMHAVLRRANA